MSEQMVTEEVVFLDVALKKPTKKVAIDAIATGLAEQLGMDRKAVMKGFLKREKLSTTGFGSGFAIPHTKANIEKGVVAFFRFAQPVEWEAMDGQPVTNAVALVMPENDGDNQHLQMISKLARLLMHPEFIEQLDQLQDAKRISAFLSEQIGGESA